MEENASLKKRAAKLEEEAKQKEAAESDVFSVIAKDEEKVRYYTGLPSLAAFLLVLRMVVLCGFEKFRSLSVENTLLVILVKLKLGTTNRDLGYRFGLSATYVSTILSTRLAHLARVGRELIHWPTREAVFANLPNCFRVCRGDLRRTRVIVDCFEIRTERPKALVPRAQLWSNYKSHSTVKVLMGISPSGAVTFVSKAWGGRAYHFKTVSFLIWWSPTMLC